MLRNSFPGYERWAAEATKQVVAQQATLDAAAQASYNVLGRKIDMLTEEVCQKDQRLAQQVNLQQQQMNLLQQQLATQQQSPFATYSVSMAPTHQNPIQVSMTNAVALLCPSACVPEIPLAPAKTIH
jgi:hypothetical protein